MADAVVLLHFQDSFSVQSSPRVEHARTIGAIGDESGITQRCAYGFAVPPSARRPAARILTRAGEPRGFSLLVETQPWSVTAPGSQTW